LYALQQALLYENACVMLVLQKTKDSILCIRKNDTIYAWNVANGSCESDLFRNSNVLVLLDPNETGAKFIMGLRRLLYAASNNKKHFIYHLEKDNPTFDKNLNPYSDKELLVSSPYMLLDVAVSDADLRAIIHRRKAVGNLPRYIISEESFKRRESATKTSIDSIKEDEIENVLKHYSGLTEDTNDPNRVTIPGAIFSILAQSSASDNGYDGQKNVEYEKRELGLMSTSVEDLLISKYRDQLLGCFTYRPDSFSALGMRLEKVFALDLNVGRKARIYKLPVQFENGKAQFKTRSIGSRQNSDQMNSVLPTCTISDLNERVFSKNNMKEGTPTIDFAGPGRKVYQSTISKKKQFKSLGGLEELFLASGHLVKNKENGLDVPKNLPPILEFYWVIPYYIASEWIRKNPISIQDKSSQRILKNILDNTKCVQQYVLVIDTDITFNDAMSALKKNKIKRPCQIKTQTTNKKKSRK
jgi:hypothetical protein